MKPSRRSSRTRPFAASSTSCSLTKTRGIDVQILGLLLLGFVVWYGFIERDILDVVDGKEIRLADLWPSDQEIDAIVAASVRPEMFRQVYEPMFAIHADYGEKARPQYDWRPRSTYIRRPPYWDSEGVGARRERGSRARASDAPFRRRAGNERGGRERGGAARPMIRGRRTTHITTGWENRARAAPRRRRRRRGEAGAS